MSTRLDLALQEVAAAAADASGFGDPDDDATAETVRRIAARVRRQRAVRGATTTAVAASAAGAVALVVPQLTQEISPAADPDAAPGTCRSTVQQLEEDTGGSLALELGYRTGGSTAQLDTARGGHGLGSWQGDSADLVVAVSQVPPAGVGETRLRLLVAQDDVVVATTQERLSSARTTTQEVLRTELGRTYVDAGDDVPVVPLVKLSDRWWEAVDGTSGTLRAAQSTELDLRACDDSGALEAGTYQVWATTVDGLGVTGGVAGPWDLVVEDDDATPHRLPADFPDDVPLVPGRLVTAHRHGAGWAAEIVTPGHDRAVVAASLLARVALPDPDRRATQPRPPEDVVASPSGIAVPGWDVRAVASHTPDGEESVVYVLVPRG